MREAQDRASREEFHRLHRRLVYGRRGAQEVFTRVAELKTNPTYVYVIGHRLTKLLKAEVAKLEQQLA